MKKTLMKKTMTLFLALAMLMSMTSVAFAAENDDVPVEAQQGATLEEITTIVENNGGKILEVASVERDSAWTLYDSGEITMNCKGMFSMSTSSFYKNIIKEITTV